jgi:hypothetical protein
MAIIVQYMFRQIPGQRIATLTEAMQAGAALWKKHGSRPRMWAGGVGDIGNYAVTNEFADYAAYGKCQDALLADPDFRAWFVTYQESGVGEWLRSSILREMPG